MESRIFSESVAARERASLLQDDTATYKLDTRSYTLDGQILLLFLY